MPVNKPHNKVNLAINKFAKLSVQRGASINDFLYLPSNLTYEWKEEMIRKFGD